jgi:hypothetical protein
MCSVEQDGRLSTLYPERFTWYARGGSVVQTFSKINFIRYSKPRRWNACLMCLCFISYLNIAFVFHSFVQTLWWGCVLENDVLKYKFSDLRRSSTQYKSLVQWHLFELPFFFVPWQEMYRTLLVT